MIDPRVLTLIAITDGMADGEAGLLHRAAAAARGGATMLQLRLKYADARSLVEVARALVETLPVPVIINDRVDVALASGAAGVHLGADDLPVSAARAIAPDGFIVGVSVGSDDEVPGAAGADYVGVGPVFGTRSKSDAGAAIGVERFARLSARTALPSVGIGGVTAENAAEVIGAGAAGVAVISALLGARDPELAARALRSSIGR
jgi:thiamine-phosphate pyrophosphorylase